MAIHSVVCGRPQPYRALKESDSADGEDVGSPERAREPLPPSPLLSSKASEVNLLEDIFPSLGVDGQPQPLSQAKSLEDLRTPKEEAEQRCSFEYQVRGFLCPGTFSYYWGDPIIISSSSICFPGICLCVSKLISELRNGLNGTQL